MGGGGQVLENERGCRGMPGCWYKLSNVDPQPDAKSVISVHSAGKGAKNSAGIRRGEPYTSSADEAFKSSFHVLRISNRNDGRFRHTVHWHGT